MGIVEWRCDRCGGKLFAERPTMCRRCNRVVCWRCTAGIPLLRIGPPVCRDCASAKPRPLDPTPR